MAFDVVVEKLGITLRIQIDRLDEGKPAGTLRWTDQPLNALAPDICAALRKNTTAARVQTGPRNYIWLHFSTEGEARNQIPLVRLVVTEILPLDL
jgi:hypothetical protein